MNWIDKYLNYCKGSGKADSTIRQRKGTLINFKTKDILSPTLDELLAYFSEPKKAPSTLLNRHTNLLGFYQWLHGQNIILRNPMLKIKAPKIPSSLPQKIMTKGEVVKVLDAAKNEKIFDRLILEILYTSSLRASEVAMLNVKDYDSENNLLRINFSKTKKGRLVPVGQVASDLLKEFLGDRKTGPLFPNPWGNHFRPTYISKLAKRVREKAKIRTKATSHSFRKSSATHMLRDGAPLSVVQALLGHSRMRSTEVYTKIYPSDLIKMHRAFHPRERQKNIKLPSFDGI